MFSYLHVSMYFLADADDNHDCWDVCSLYLSKVNHTASGTRCQSWHAQVPHRHYYQSDEWFPFEGLGAVENYCRDPEGGWWKPWCFTEDPDVRWEQCDIPLCNSTYYMYMNHTLIEKYLPSVDQLANRHSISTSVLPFHTSGCGAV